MQQQAAVVANGWWWWCSQWLVSVPGNPEPSNSWEEIADWERVDWEKTLLKSVAV